MADRAVVQAVAERIIQGSYNPYGGENLAERFAFAAIEALRSLPVEQRMEAMGMERVSMGWRGVMWVPRAGNDRG